jgi:hypothetical protein
VELNDLYSPLNIFRVITSRIMRLAWHVANMEEGEVSICFWWLNLKERDHIEDTGLDGRIILRGPSGSGMWGHRLIRSVSG